MKSASRRVRRMDRHRKMRKASPLNLVSLMDIFTILVFFLLVNSSSTQQLPNKKDLQLPTSAAKKSPKETLVLVITPDSILVQGRHVTEVAAWMNSEEDVIAPLEKELRLHGSSRQLATEPVLDEQDEVQGAAITIMGDENIPYELLRKVLATCQQANYTEIAFAAHQKAKRKK